MPGRSSFLITGSLCLFITLISNCTLFEPELDGFPSVAVSKQIDGVYQICTVSTVNKGEKILTDGPLENRYPCWSPDGKKILYMSIMHKPRWGVRGEISFYTMNPDGSDQVKIFHVLDDSITNIGNVSWSPGGNRILFTGGLFPEYLKSEVLVLKSDGSELLNISNNMYNDHSPVFSADGSKIAYVSKLDGNDTVLFIVNPDGTGRQQVTDLIGVSQPSWSPDGKRLVFIHDFYLYVANIDDGSYEKITTESQNRHGHPIWSPDGKWILYREIYGQLSELFIVSPGGGDRKQLTVNTNVSGSYGGLQWSRSGSKILFTHLRDLYTMNLNGGDTDLVASDVSDPAVNPTIW